MWIILWAVAALVAGGAVLAGGAWIAAQKQPKPELPPGETMGSTPLQRKARWAIALGAVISAAAAGVVAYYGPIPAFESDTVRIVVTLLLLAALGVLAGFGMQMQRLAKRDDATIDERDRAILSRAPAAQGAAILVTLAVWIVALQQTYWSVHQVPMDFLYMIFWSCVIVSQLALPIGVLLGYRRS